MKGRRLELRTGIGQHLRILADGGPSLYLSAASHPAQIVLRLMASDVRYVVETMTDWLEEQDAAAADCSALNSRSRH